jgi:hypothetical protein
MGPAGLTAVFGMGTGVAPQVWSPGIRDAGGEAGASGKLGVHNRSSSMWRGRSVIAIADTYQQVFWHHSDLLASRFGLRGAAGRGGQAAWLLGPVG